MRIKTLAGIGLAAALLLPGKALAGAPVIFGMFITQDELEAQNNCAEIEFDGEFFEVNGEVTGIGNDNDTVIITYDQDFPDSIGAKSDKGKIRQRNEGQIVVDVVSGGGPAANYTGVATPTKCSIQGRSSSGGTTSRVSVRCKDVLSALAPAPDAAQLATLDAAFSARKDVKVKNDDVGIRHKGVDAPGGCGGL